MNKAHLDCSPLLTAKEAGMYLKVSVSWLAKARMRGDVPTVHPYRPLGPLCRGHSRSLDEFTAALLHQ